MSARSDLAGLIREHMPDSWQLHDHPIGLLPFDDAGKPVAVVIEQRSITAGTTPPAGDQLRVGVELALWVVVDGSRGADSGDLEDQLEAAAEQMIAILEPLPEHVWDGAAVRDAYDAQKPAYQFTIRAAGALTQEVTA